MSTQETQQFETFNSVKEQKLAEYLRQEVRKSSSDLYIKGKFIADDVDMSPKQIGQLMKQIQGKIVGIEIEKWSYTNATTWRVGEASAEV